MKIPWIAVAISAAMILLPAGTARADTRNNLSYEVDDSRTEITITGYSGSESSVEIPNEIDNIAVTAIGYKAFFNCDSLTEITVPEGVSRIEEDAFQYCDNLRICA